MYVGMTDCGCADAQLLLALAAGPLPARAQDYADEAGEEVCAEQAPLDSLPI